MPFVFVLVLPDTSSILPVTRSLSKTHAQVYTRVQAEKKSAKLLFAVFTLTHDVLMPHDGNLKELYVKENI